MNTRLEQFLSAENISQAQFAETIGVARASISHILAGRNKPGYDFISSLMLHYPRLNVEWLFFGKGKMYKDMAGAAPQAILPEEPVESNLFSDEKEEEVPIEDAAPAQIPDSHEVIEEPAPKPAAQKRISRIIVFYDDNTFTELS